MAHAVPNQPPGGHVSGWRAYPCLIPLYHCCSFSLFRSWILDNISLWVIWFLRFIQFGLSLLFINIHIEVECRNTIWLVLAFEGFLSCIDFRVRLLFLSAFCWSISPNKRNNISLLQNKTQNMSWYLLHMTLRKIVYSLLFTRYTNQRPSTGMPEFIIQNITRGSCK